MEDSINIQIENYISNSMSEEKRALFETKMANDKELKTKVELAKELNHFLIGKETPLNRTYELDQEYKMFIQSEEATDLKKTIKKAHKNTEIRQDSSKTTNIKSYFLAASIALLVGFLGLNLFKGNDKHTLYTIYYASSDLPSVIKRNELKNELVLGVLAFKKNDFQKAVTHFEKYKTDNTKIDDAVYLYEGVSYLNTNNNQKALTEFNLMINSNSIDNSKGYWFKALLYLKNNQIDKTKTLLNKIINEKSFNHQKAKKLLSKL